MEKGIASFFLFILEVFKIALMALVIVVPIRYFLFQPFFVNGQSMEPSFQNGDYLIIDELSYRLSDPQRGDVVVFKYPYNPTQKFIKRIIGLPGEKVEVSNGSVIIYSEDGSQVLSEEYLDSGVSTPGAANVFLDQDEYFVLGDNRPVSSDSRTWGTLPRENIIGKVFLRAWPVGAFTKIELPVY